MKVQHLTIGGNSVVRDTDSILSSTKAFFKNFAISPERNVGDFHVPGTALTVRITRTPEGAMFNLQKGEDIAFVNACCFSPEYTDEVYSLVKTLVKSNPFLNRLPSPVEPTHPLWLYTIPIAAQFMLTPDEMRLCGEIELYIYYQLLKAR